MTHESKNKALDMAVKETMEELLDNRILGIASFLNHHQLETVVRKSMVKGILIGFSAKGKMDHRNLLRREA